MKFVSTRGKDSVASSYEAIFKGLAGDGGLFVKEDLGNFDREKYLGEGVTYSYLAAKILHHIFEDIDFDELYEMTQNAYDKKFYKKDAVSLKNLEGISVAELYHGQTAAFKDFALSILPQFLKRAKGDKDLIILTATSGDTGKAALEGFKDIDGIEIFVFYPTKGVSTMQKLQMTSQEGSNCHVIGIDGNFDHAQNAVKTIFSNKEIKKDLAQKNKYLSSANSINIGRLVPQIAYYVFSYIKLVEDGIIEKGEKIDVCVPTGNFGDILAGYYAKKMGLPIEKLVCASNSNKVLTDFFETGIYNAQRDLLLTSSPSMDILVSSNLERLLFDISKDANLVEKRMRDLKEKKSFDIGEYKEKLSDFSAFFASDEEVEEAIKEVFEKYGYLIDTHTGVGYQAIKKYGPKNHMLLMSTASAYKFPEAVAKALDLDFDDYKEAIEKIHQKTGMEIPKPLKDLDKKKILHNKVIGKDQIQEEFLRRVND
jgi:threonine synthase